MYECSWMRSRNWLATTALWTFTIPVTYAATEEQKKKIQLEWWNATKKLITKPRAYKHHLHSIWINSNNEKLKIKRMPSLVAFMCATVDTHQTFRWQLANFFWMSSPFESAPIIPQNTTFISPSIDKILDVFNADPPGWEFRKTHLETHQK